MTVSAADIVVRERIGLERRRLLRIDSLRTAGPAAALVEQLAGDRINALLSDLGQRFNGLEAKAARGVTHVTLIDLAGLQQAVDRAAAEILDLAMGALARQAGLDDGASSEAELLVSWLAALVDKRFTRPTLPGTAYALHAATDVIHRPVPDHGLWDLPVMAHEFGHVVASGLRSWDALHDQVLRPVESLLSGCDGRSRSRATELFCDVFATFTMGPSYLCTLVFHRLSAVASSAASGTHPPDPSRVYACQWALARMRGGADLHPFDRQLLRAADAWEQMLADVPEGARLDGSEQARLNSELGRCWSALTTNLSAMRYQPSGVRDLVHVLEASDRTSLPVSRPTSPPTSSPADVLNAAWIVRLDAWFDGRPAPVDLESRARALLRSSREGEADD